MSLSPYLPKRQIGWLLYAFGSFFPGIRPHLSRWGRRTRRDWFPGRMPFAESRGTGLRVKLASFSENYLSFELFWRGLDYYEPLTTHLADNLAGRSGLFLDVGANIGFYALRLAAARPDLEVIAFEPHPRVYRLLAANVRENHFRHVKTEPMALSNRDGVLPFYLNRSDMSSSLEPSFDDNHTGTVDVRTASLDSYLAARDVPDRFLMKVDVEGHEPAFFAGAERTLRRHQPDIIAEAAVPYPEGTVALLERCGYRFRQITDQGLQPCAAPTAYLRDSYVFLNCLLTTRPDAELAELSALLKAQAKSIDLSQTSKRADDRVVDRCRQVFDLPEPLPVRSLAALPGRWPNPQMK